jgi:hypothetical protein
MLTTTGDPLAGRLAIAELLDFLSSRAKASCALS